MKNLLKLLLLAGLFMGGFTLNAQDLKFGHIDSRELLMSMPESDSAQAKIQKLAEDYEQQIVRRLPAEPRNLYEPDQADQGGRYSGDAAADCEL
jgi:hypothetical protein